MAVPFTIKYPPTYNPNDPHKTSAHGGAHGNFAAFGDSPFAPSAISGVLYKSSDPNTKWTGEPQHTKAPLWCLFFRGVPPGHGYVLEIRKNNDLLGKVQPVGVTGSFGVGISYPLSDETVSSSFVSWGDTDQVSDVTVTITGANSSVDPVAQPEATKLYWIMQIGVETGKAFTLSAQNALGASATPSTNVTAS